MTYLSPEVDYTDIVSESLPRGRTVSVFSPPEIYVGEFGYPRVQIGFVGTLNLRVKPNVLSSPEIWVTMGRQDFFRLRSEMFRFIQKVDISENNPWIEFLQNIVMANNFIKVNVSAYKIPKRKSYFLPIGIPFGPVVLVNDAYIESDFSIDPYVERIISKDLVSRVSVWSLYQYGKRYYEIVQLMSLGLIGKLNHRKLLPTRYAMGAVESILVSRLKEEVMRYPPIDLFEIHKFNAFGDKFIVVLAPGDLNFIYSVLSNKSEESKIDSKIISAFVNGNLSDVSFQDAPDCVKFPILEYLYNIQRSASAIVFRYSKDRINRNMGSWFVRNSIKMALNQRPKIFEREDILYQMYQFASVKLAKIL